MEIPNMHENLCAMQNKVSKYLEITLTLSTCFFRCLERYALHPVVIKTNSLVTRSPIQLTLHIQEMKGEY